MTDAQAIADLLGLSRSAGWAAVLAFLRVGAAMALLPAFGEATVPVRVRLAAALAFTAVVAPSLIGRPLPPPGFAAAGAEVAAGLALGAVLRLLVLALSVAGTIAAQATSLSQIFGGLSAEAQPAMGNVLVVTGLALAAAAGLHLKAAEYLILSYDLIPPGRLPAAADAAAWGLSHAARAFALAFSLAAPFVIAATVFNLALGVVNRAMPQLMVAFVGAPALTLGGLALLALAAPLALAVWMQALAGLFAAPPGAPGLR